MPDQEDKALAVIEPAELTIRLENPLSALTPNVRHQIETAARAVAISLGISGLSDNFDAIKAELISDADDFSAPPADDVEQEEMLSAQRALTAFRIAVTKKEDEYKRPLNDAKTKIIALVKAGLVDVEKAEKRIQGFINNRQQKLMEARREAQLAQEREAQRLAAEAAEAAHAAQEAEKAREAAAKANDPAEQARLAAEAARLEDEAFAKQLDAESAPLAAVPVSEAPQAKEIVEFSIIGENTIQQKASMIKLLCAHPELFSVHCKTETPRSFSLTLKIADLTDRLNGRMTPAITEAPGITIHKTLSKLR